MGDDISGLQATMLSPSSLADCSLISKETVIQLVCGFCLLSVLTLPHPAAQLAAKIRLANKNTFFQPVSEWENCFP